MRKGFWGTCAGVYDSQNSRFVVAALRRAGGGSDLHSSLALALSITSDPLGFWHVYDIDSYARTSRHLLGASPVWPSKASIPVPLLSLESTAHQSSGVLLYTPNSKPKTLYQIMTGQLRPWCLNEVVPPFAMYGIPRSLAAMSSRLSLGASKPWDTLGPFSPPRLPSPPPYGGPWLEYLLGPSSALFKCMRPLDA